jgi:hypothetical protein
MIVTVEAPFSSVRPRCLRVCVCACEVIVQMCMGAWTSPALDCDLTR